MSLCRPTEATYILLQQDGALGILIEGNCEGVIGFDCLPYEKCEFTDLDCLESEG